MSANRPDIEAIKQRVEKATAGPWIDATRIWREIELDFKTKHGNFWHGNFRGSRGKASNKSCTGLVIQASDRYGQLKGAAFVEEWQKSGTSLLDWHSMVRIIGTPYDAYKWPGGSRMYTESVDGGSKRGEYDNPDRDFLANARQDIPDLIAYIEHLEKQIEHLRGAAKTGDGEEVGGGDSKTL